MLPVYLNSVVRWRTIIIILRNIVINTKLDRQIYDLKKKLCATSVNKKNSSETSVLIENANRSLDLVDERVSCSQWRQIW